MTGQKRTMTGDRAGLTFREDYFGDPAGWAAVKALLVEVFGIDVSPLDRMGGPDPTLMSSAWFDDVGRCVANFSAFAMPLVIDGRPINAAAFQSGAVLPEYRGRGLFGDLVRRLLQRCDACGFEAAVLYTDKPALYPPHGFRILPEHHFTGPPPVNAAVAAPVAAGDKPSCRTLEMGEERDLSLLRDLLSRRAPVCERFAVTGNPQTFLLNTALVEGVTLSYLPSHSAVVAWNGDGDGGTFRLIDVVAPRIPPLAAIVQALGCRPAAVEVMFAPDRLGWRGEAIAENGELCFMIRGHDGPLPQDGFRLSPMAEF